jgi:hypothetical protein
MPETKKDSGKTLRRFRLVGSTHQSGKGEKRRTYKTGDIVESEANLVVTVPGKFVELTDKTASLPTPVAYGVSERDSHGQDTMTPFHPYQPPTSGYGVTSPVVTNPDSLPPPVDVARSQEREDWLEDKGLEQTPEQEEQEKRNEKMMQATQEHADSLRANQEAQVRAPAKAKASAKKQTLTTNPAQPQPTTPARETVDDSEEVDLDDMTVTELRKYAADNKIDLKGATTKQDIVKVIERS